MTRKISRITSTFWKSTSHDDIWSMYVCICMCSYKYFVTALKVNVIYSTASVSLIAKKKSSTVSQSVCHLVYTMRPYEYKVKLMFITDRRSSMLHVQKKRVIITRGLSLWSSCPMSRVRGSWSQGNLWDRWRVIVAAGVECSVNLVCCTLPGSSCSQADTTHECLYFSSNMNKKNCNQSFRFLPVVYQSISLSQFWLTFIFLHK